MTSGAPQLPRFEFLEVDDYGSTHELPAHILADRRAFAAFLGLDHPTSSHS